MIHKFIGLFLLLNTLSEAHKLQKDKIVWVYSSSKTNNFSLAYEVTPMTTKYYLIKLILDGGS